MQKIKESRSNLNIHVREISADAIRRDRVIDDFLIVDRDLGWSEQRQIEQVPHDDLSCAAAPKSGLMASCLR